MKAEDLMVGDLCVVNRDVCINKSTIVKVLGVDSENTFEQKGLVGCVSCFCLNDIDRFSCGVWCEYLSPIPLTPDVLEKNGFVHYDLADFWLWKKKSFEPVRLDKYENGGWRLHINCDYIPCECKYVHQLQHALRLCKIEKEIIL